MLPLVSIALIVLLLGTLFAVALHSVAAQSRRLVSRDLRAAVAARTLHTADAQRVHKTQLFLQTGNPAYLAERSAATRRFEQALSILRSLDGTGAEPLLTEIATLHAQVVAEEGRIVGQREGGASAEASSQALQRVVLPRQDELGDALSELSDVQFVQLEEARLAAEQSEVQGQTLLVLGILLALVLLVVLGAILERASRELIARGQKLEAALSYQKQVMGIVGHDIRSPLAALLTTLSARRMSEGGVADQRRNARMLRAARRIQALASLLVDYTRLQPEVTLPIVPHAADLHEVVARAVRLLQRDHPDWAIVHERQGDGRGEFDPERVEQMADTLLRHALEHLPAHTPVRVVTRGGDGLLGLELYQPPPPTAAELLPLLATPLSPGTEAGMVRLSRSVDLYLVRQMVEAHEGTLDVNEDDGTGLVIHLPRHPSPDEGPRPLH